MSDRTIGTGTYIVDAPCPECGTIVGVLVRLSSVLTIAQDDTPQLRVRCKGESVGHHCRGGHQVDVFEAIAEATAALDEPDVKIDGAQLQAFERRRAELKARPCPACGAAAGEKCVSWDESHATRRHRG